MDSEPRSQPTDQKCDLRTLCTAIHVRFVEDERQELPSSRSHCRVSSKIGRSNGRISMYSSIE